MCDNVQAVQANLEAQAGNGRLRNSGHGRTFFMFFVTFMV
jgi:hypothetical protein